MRKEKLIVLFCLLSTCVFPQTLEKGFYLYQGFAGLDYPVGVMSDTAVFYRIPVSQGSGMLFESSHADIGLENWFTPTDNFLALYFKLEPIAFFDIVFRGGQYDLFNLTGIGFQPVSGPNVPYDPESASKLSHENRSGLWCMITPTFKVKFWNIILTHSLTLNYFNMNYSGYFTEIHTDSILHGEDINMQNVTYGFYELSRQLLIGINHYFLSVPSTGYVSERLASAAVFKPALPWFDNVFITALAGTYLQDHSYTGKFFVLFQAGFIIKI